MNLQHWLLAATLIIFQSSAYAVAKTKQVKCDDGMSLAHAVRTARAGTTLYVSGTCNEQVTIKRDRIKLIGKNGASIDGAQLDPAQFEFNPLVRIVDAVGVVIKDLAIINGPAEGIIVEGKANVTLNNLNVSHNSNVGVLVDHARVVVNGGSYESNQGGIDVVSTGAALLQGAISLQHNIIFGIAASNGASLEVRGASLNASNNQLAGVLLEGGNMAIFNFGVSVGSQILADQNGLCGLVLVGGGFLDVVAPPPFYFSGVHQINTSNNAVCGILMATGSKLESPFGSATFTVAGNGAGMTVSGNSDVSINGGLNIINNLGPGLIADGAGVLTLAPLDPSPPPALPTEISGNAGPDVVLNFGSRATFATNVNVGSIVCDGTALARGAATCP
ncbi:MAG: hypothetical protein RJQ07_06805 [Pseudomonadales bacterium]